MESLNKEDTAMEGLLSFKPNPFDWGAITKPQPFSEEFIRQPLKSRWNVKPLEN